MTADEIAAEDVKYAGWAALKKVNNTNRRVVVFEMGESGQTVALSISTEPTTADGTSNNN